MHSYYKYSIFCKLLLVYIKIYIIRLFWLHRAVNLKVMFQDKPRSLPSNLLRCHSLCDCSALLLPAERAHARCHCHQALLHVLGVNRVAGFCGCETLFTSGQLTRLQLLCLTLAKSLLDTRCIQTRGRKCCSANWCKPAFKPCITFVCFVCVRAYVRVSVCVHFFSQLQL